MTLVQPQVVVDRASTLLRPDPRRVVARLFVPGHEDLIPGQSRVDPVIERILALRPPAVRAAVATIMEQYGHRHHDLIGILKRHFGMVAHRLGATSALPEATQLLIGAYFTHEYSLEAAALFNPSVVKHPDQTGVAPDETRVVMSLRAVGEGHRSSIEFRSGVITHDGQLRIENTTGKVSTGTRRDSTFDGARFRRILRELGNDAEDATFVLDSLPTTFSGSQLEAVLSTLHGHSVTRRTADRTIEHLRWIADSNYEVEFPEYTALDERALLPTGPTELNGMEDARFVRFTDDDGAVTYLGTYTAYDGRRVAPQLLTTSDFRTFRISQLTGGAAVNKGIALFPRPVGGRRLALSRWDRETISLASSADGFTWDRLTTIAAPTQPWELIQMGNCGSPIETLQGWLVMTHGVGPMRSYGIGAMLLDLEDPAQVLGRLTQPLLVPTEDERDGYVPNVVYSCGALADGDRLVLPYGSADSSIGVAVMDLPLLIRTMLG